MEHALLKTDIEGYLKDPKTNVIVAGNLERLRSLKIEQQKIKQLDGIRRDVDSLRADLEKLYTHLGFNH